MDIDIVLSINMNPKVSNETHVTNERIVNFDGKVIDESI
jgi:hypothetical protein